MHKNHCKHCTSAQPPRKKMSRCQTRHYLKFPTLRGWKLLTVHLSRTGKSYITLHLLIYGGHQSSLAHELCSRLLNAAQTPTLEIFDILTTALATKKKNIDKRWLKDRCYTWGQISSKFVNTRRTGGRGENENFTWCIIYIFNFSSATRGHFSNVRTLFTSMDPLSKKRPSDTVMTSWLRRGTIDLLVRWCRR